jgi:hypothetical protein
MVGLNVNGPTAAGPKGLDKPHILGEATKPVFAILMMATKKYFAAKH